jgi:hypothetical protein
MHMQNPVPPKVIPQVLPRSHHPLQLSTVYQRTIGEPPLRPIHPHSPAPERSKMAVRPAMNLIALRHRPSSSHKTENNGDGIFTVATSLNQLKSIGKNPQRSQLIR